VEIFQFESGWFAKVESGIRLGNLYKKLWEFGNFTFNAGSCLGYFILFNIIVLELADIYLVDILLNQRWWFWNAIAYVWTFVG
jgi:hypothetical protein